MEPVEDLKEDAAAFKEAANEIKKNVKADKENATQIIIDEHKVKRNQESTFLTLKEWTDPAFNLK